MYEKLENCPLCKHTSFSNQLICEDYLVTGESFAIVQCQKCGLLFTNPRPATDDLSKYYKSDTYISHSNKANTLINLVYKVVRQYTLSGKVQLINSLTEQRKLLDYGCGTGDFLATAHHAKWKVYGYEPNPEARTKTENKIPNSTVAALTEIQHPIDVITAWHVLEHVEELLPTIKALTKKLSPQGHLILALPNHRSYDAMYFKEKWAAYDVPRHLYHFNRNTINTLAAKAGLKVKKVLPMKFDSYYVSMLSLQNNGQANLFKALKIGWKSNRLASKTGEYSSLIYILTK